MSGRAGRVMDSDLVGGRFVLRVRASEDLTVRLLVDTCGGSHVRPDLATVLPRAALPDDQRGVGVRVVLDPPMPATHDVALLLPPQIPDVDGVVGAWWFVDRVWSFDYPAGRLTLLDGYDGAGIADLALPRGPEGSPLLPYPRVRVAIDDEELDVIFDTGATTHLTPRGLNVLGEPRVRASSFMAASVVQRWRSRHPDWPYVEGASEFGDSAMIKVARVRLGERDLGPDWFEQRPDANFVEMMSQWTDVPVVGALGASSYGHLRVVLDYVRGRVGIG